MRPAASVGTRSKVSSNVKRQQVDLESAQRRAGSFFMFISLIKS